SSDVCSSDLGALCQPTAARVAGNAADAAAVPGRVLAVERASGGCADARLAPRGAGLGPLARHLSCRGDRLAADHLRATARPTGTLRRRRGGRVLRAAEARA